VVGISTGTGKAWDWPEAASMAGLRSVAAGSKSRGWDGGGGGAFLKTHHKKLCANQNRCMMIS
jgi:hypothetical protein